LRTRRRVAALWLVTGAKSLAELFALSNRKLNSDKVGHRRLAPFVEPIGVDEPGQVIVRCGEDGIE